MEGVVERAQHRIDREAGIDDERGREERQQYAEATAPRVDFNLRGITPGGALTGTGSELGLMKSGRASTDCSASPISGSERLASSRKPARC